MRIQKALAIALVGSAALVTASFALGMGPGMMGGAFGGSGGGGAGSKGTAKPTAAQLTGVRDQVNGWLGSNGFKGFKVAEIMAFTNNDYVAVHDTSGKPAFELLTDLNTNWLMEEPPSMMWNTRYGVMGDFGSRVSPMMGGSMMSGGWNGWYGRRRQGRDNRKAVAIANSGSRRRTPASGSRVTPAAWRWASSPATTPSTQPSTARPTGCSPSTPRQVPSGITAGTAHSSAKSSSRARTSLSDDRLVLHAEQLSSAHGWGRCSLLLSMRDLQLFFGGAAARPGCSTSR